MAEYSYEFDISGRSDLRELVEQLVADGHPYFMQVDDKIIAILTPLNSVYESGGCGEPTHRDDRLWHIVGRGSGEGAGDVSEDVERYLAEAYTTNEG